VRLPAILLLPMALGACSTPVPRTVLTPIETYIPVSRSCLPSNVQPAPTYPDTDAALRAAPDGAVRYQLEHAGRKLRIARLNELEPIVAGCK